MGASLVLLLLVILLIVGVLTAAMYRQGDLFAWSRHPITRAVFGVVGIILISALVVPELRPAKDLRSATEPMMMSAPAESLLERFPAPKGALHAGSARKETWSGGRIIVNMLYVDPFGHILGEDGVVADWDGESRLVLKGDHALGRSRIEYELQVDQLRLKYTDGDCTLEVDGRQDVDVHYAGGHSGTSGGLNQPDQGELIIMSTGGWRGRGGFSLRRRHVRSGVMMVALLHPLPSPDAVTVTVPASTYLEPYLPTLLHGDHVDDPAQNYQRLRYGRHDADMPPFFALCGAIGSGAPLILLAGFVLVALAFKSHRGLTVLGALLATSVTLVVIDGVITHRALAVAADEDLDAAARASALDTAAASFFHAHAASEVAAELVNDEALDPAIRQVAWWLRVGAELETIPVSHRNLGHQLTSGYDHDHADSWYGIWKVTDTDGRMKYLVVRPTPHGNPYGLHWVYAELMAADMAPGIVVYCDEDMGRGPDAMRHVGSEEQMHTLMTLCVDRDDMFESDLWKNVIVPAMKRGQ